MYRREKGVTERGADEVVYDILHGGFCARE